MSCFNGAGVASNASLGPLSFDDTPPSFEANALSTVGLRAHRGIDYSSNSVVRLRVGVAMDLESGLRSLVLRVHARGSSRSWSQLSVFLALADGPPPPLACLGLVSWDSLTHFQGLQNQVHQRPRGRSGGECEQIAGL